MACICLTLTGENRKVQQGSLIIRGKMETVEHVIEAKNIWQEVAACTNSLSF
jgi:hypothetical protein